jgi:3D (Asp-Asp-Asp) domain-containing protein
VFNREVGRGRVLKVESGVEGRKYTRYAQIMSGEKLVAEKVVKRTVHPPSPTVFHMGPDGYATSRGSFNRARVARMESTAYTPDAGLGSRATFRTATGRRAQYGVVAVDPRVIPLHTLLFVEGYGFAVAADTGGAIKGNIIDVCLPTNAECRQWGRRQVTVHIFRERLARKE